MGALKLSLVFSPTLSLCVHTDKAENDLTGFKIVLLGSMTVQNKHKTTHDWDFCKFQKMKAELDSFSLSVDFIFNNQKSKHADRNSWQQIAEKINVSGKIVCEIARVIKIYIAQNAPFFTLDFLFYCPQNDT